MHKIIIILLFFSFPSFSQEFSLNSSNFEAYIREVYKDEADVLIFSRPKILEKKKKLLERIVIINNIDKVEDYYLDFENLHVVTTYNKTLQKTYPEKINPNLFNPFLFKMNTYNSNPVYYYYSKSKQLIKIYPQT